MKANGQSLRSEDGCRQVCCVRPSNTPSESERTDIRKTQDAAEGQKHHPDVGIGGRVLKYAKKVDEDAKIVALKSIMPETLFGEAGEFRGRSFNFCADLCTAIIKYLNDKVPVSIMKQGPPISTTNMVQTLSTGDQGKMRSPKMRYSPRSSSTGKVKAKARAKEERREHAGTVVKVITTTEIARITNKTTLGQMVEHGRIRKAARQAKLQAKDGTQARAIGTVGEAVRAKAKTGKGVVRPKNGKARTGRMIGARQHGMVRTRKAAARAASTVLTKPVTSTDGRSQTDHSPAHNQKNKFNSACGDGAKCKLNDVRYIRKKMQ